MRRLTGCAGALPGRPRAARTTKPWTRCCGRRSRPLSDPSGTTDTSMDVMAALRRLVPDQQAALSWSICSATRSLTRRRSSAYPRAQSRAAPRAAAPGLCPSSPICGRQRLQIKRPGTGRPGRASNLRRRGVMTRCESACHPRRARPPRSGRPERRKAARIRHHLATCAQCTELNAQLPLSRVLSTVDFGPMPDNLSARIETALAVESRQRLASEPATEAGRRELPAPVRRSGRRRWCGPGRLAAAGPVRRGYQGAGHRRRDRPDRRRRLRDSQPRGRRHHNHQFRPPV